MKKIISMILVLFSTLVLAVEPKPGVNFKTTKNVIPTESKDKILKLFAKFSRIINVSRKLQ